MRKINCLIIYAPNIVETLLDPNVQAVLYHIFNSIQAQRQLDALELKAGKVGLEVYVQKTEQMRLNQSFILSQNDPLVIKANRSTLSMISNTSVPTLDRQNAMLKY